MAKQSPLPHLATFSKAAELSSFTAAAKELGMTQAAVSQRIHALEHELETALFERRGGRVFLSDAGRRLYEYAEQILELHRKAREEVTGKRIPLAGKLLLAASSVPGEHLLPAVLSILRRKYPSVQVRVGVSDSEQVVELVQKGKAHVGLVGRKIDRASLQYDDLATDEMVVVLPANHRWRKRKQISFDRFREEPVILREPGSGSRWCLEQALTRSGRSIHDLHIALELDSNEAIKEAVLQGIGISVVSTHAVRKELSSGTLRGIEIAELPLQRKLFIVTDSRRVLPSPARLFLHYLAGDSLRGPTS